LIDTKKEKNKKEREKKDTASVTFGTALKIVSL